MIEFGRVSTKYTDSFKRNSDVIEVFEIEVQFC